MVVRDPSVPLCLATRADGGEQGVLAAMWCMGILAEVNRIQASTGMATVWGPVALWDPTP